jgi:hypothetical protein
MTQPRGWGLGGFFWVTVTESAQPPPGRGSTGTRTAPRVPDLSGFSLIRLPQNLRQQGLVLEQHASRFRHQRISLGPKRAPHARQHARAAGSGGRSLRVFIHECDVSRIARRVPAFPRGGPRPLSEKNLKTAQPQKTARRDKSPTSRGLGACPYS